MRTLAIQYPEALPGSLSLSLASFESEARMALAVKLFELGRLTSGQAAELAGSTRARFLLDCPRFGADSVDWDEEELAAEFAEETR
jgi:predicted HTH domain antitoxin